MKKVRLATTALILTLSMFVFSAAADTAAQPDASGAKPALSLLPAACSAQEEPGAEALLTRPKSTSEFCYFECRELLWDCRYFCFQQPSCIENCWDLYANCLCLYCDVGCG